MKFKANEGGCYSWKLALCPGFTIMHLNYFLEILSLGVVAPKLSPQQPVDFLSYHLSRKLRINGSFRFFANYFSKKPAIQGTPIKKNKAEILLLLLCSLQKQFPPLICHKVGIL